jgi:hypothetical protein
MCNHYCIYCMHRLLHLSPKFQLIRFASLPRFRFGWRCSARDKVVPVAAVQQCEPLFPSVDWHASEKLTKWTASSVTIKQVRPIGRENHLGRSIRDGGRGQIATGVNSSVFTTTVLPYSSYDPLTPSRQRHPKQPLETPATSHEYTSLQ